MITDKDWAAAHASLVADARERLGGPPTDDELEAYQAGRLSPSERERVEELLAAYPEFARALAVPFPEEDEEPGGSTELSQAEIDADWRSVEARIRSEATPQRSGARILSFRRIAELSAAAAAILFALLFVYSQVQIRRQASEPRINVVIAPPVALEPERDRGRESETTALPLAGDADEFPLIVPLPGPSSGSVYDDYRIEIVAVDSVPERPVWSRSGLHHFANDTLSLTLPRSFLAPGIYRILVFGLRGSHREELSRFLIRVPSRAPAH
jgi:hypothetical protein